MICKNTIFQQNCIGSLHCFFSLSYSIRQLNNWSFNKFCLLIYCCYASQAFCSYVAHVQFAVIMVSDLPLEILSNALNKIGLRLYMVQVLREEEGFGSGHPLCRSPFTWVIHYSSFSLLIMQFYGTLYNWFSSQLCLPVWISKSFAEQCNEKTFTLSQRHLCNSATPTGVLHLLVSSATITLFLWGSGRATWIFKFFSFKFLQLNQYSQYVKAVNDCRSRIVQ